MKRSLIFLSWVCILIVPAVAAIEIAYLATERPEYFASQIMNNLQSWSIGVIFGCGVGGLLRLFVSIDGRLKLIVER